MDAAGKLVGIVSEGDFLPSQRNRHTAQARPMADVHPLGPGEAATSFVREYGRKVSARS